MRLVQGDAEKALIHIEDTGFIQQFIIAYLNQAANHPSGNFFVLLPVKLLLTGKQAQSAE